jgi:hypothetical protein
MVEVIESGEPAIMVCHWPGIYYNNQKLGFNIFKTVVNRLEQKYGNTMLWMKLSEISQYWAAKEFIRFEESKNGMSIRAPFGTSNFTLALNKRHKRLSIYHEGKSVELKKIAKGNQLSSQTFMNDKNKSALCFDLPAGESEIRFS